MIDVYTNNGQFIITESLLESIKYNNPELLMEKEYSKLTSKQKKHYNQIKDKEAAQDAYDKDKKEEKSKNDNTDNVNPGELLSKISIYKNQIKNNEIMSPRVRDDIKNLIDTYKDSVNDDIRNEIENLDIVYKNNNDENEIKAGKDNEYYEKEIENTENYINKKLENPEDFLGFTPLLKEINESMAHSKDIIHQAESEITGVMGAVGRKDEPSKVHPYDLKKFNDAEMANAKDIKTAKDFIEGLYGKKGKTPDENRYKEAYFILRMIEQNKVSKEKLGLKNLTVSIKNTKLLDKLSRDLHNNLSYYVTDKSNEKYDLSSSSNLYDKTKSIGGLAIGGFSIKPYFSGKTGKNKVLILRYINEFINNEHKKSDSYIKQMLDVYVNEEKYKQNLLTQNNNDQTKKYKNDQYIKDFNHMVEKYLNTVAYKVEINNNAKFDNAVSVVRLDPKLNSRYIVRTISTTQQFNAKERVIGVLNKETKMPYAIMIFTPLFAKGQEIMKPLEKAISGRVTEG